MKVRIICDCGMFKAQYKAFIGWEDIWYKDCRRFKTEKEVYEAINANLYPEGKVLYEGKK
jgi:hypothetical protein